MSSATERNNRISKLFKVASQKYQPVLPPPDRKVLEHLVYSCLLEDSTSEGADEVFARLQLDYCDWNEIRVTTTVELAEFMKSLTDADEAASRLRKSLHGLFEAHYTFDLDNLKKENLGKAVEQIGKYRGMTPFTISYVTQHALGGHSIPLDSSMMFLMFTLGIVDESEIGSMKVTGLERVIAKNQGIEFASVVHQLAVAWKNTPFSNDLRALLKKIAPDAADRFSKRAGKGKADTKAGPAKTAASESTAPPKKQKAAANSSTKKAAAKTPAPKKTVSRSAAGNTSDNKKKTTKKKSAAKPAGKKVVLRKPR